MKVVTDTLGVSRQDLRTALKGGQTISQYASSLGKDPQAVDDALVNAANTKIDQLVTNGKHQPGPGRHDQGQGPGPGRQADEPPVRSARQARGCPADA